MVTIDEVMSKDVKKVSNDTPVADAAKRMRDNRVGALLVEKEKQFVGIVTDTDVVRKVVAERKNVEKVTVESIMAPLHSIGITHTLMDAHDLMRHSGVRHLAVENGGKVVGVISVGDLAAYFTWSSERKMPPQ